MLCLSAGVKPTGKLGIGDILTKVTVGLLFMAGILFVAILYFPLIQRDERLRKDLLRLETEVHRLEEANRELRVAVEAGRNDPRTVERLVRENLGFARSNEIVLHFEDSARPSGR